MAWQDIVFAAGSVIFSLALLPSVLGSDKPSIWTSVLTGSVLVVFSLTYFSLGFEWAAASTAFSAGLWFALASQVYDDRT